MKHLFPLTVLLMAFGFTPVAQASSDQPLPTSHDYKLREQMRAVQIEQAMLHRERSHGGKSNCHLQRLKKCGAQIG